ncbi:MAG TPA: WD40 repeat domain-containing protein [Blastocatellia bacterium]|nr:WD40 repeat domain-containing protein [Blastocatellia bacterium]
MLLMLLASVAAAHHWGITGSRAALPNTRWATKGHTGKVNSVAFTPDGQILASASDDTTIKLWRVADGSLVRTIRVHYGIANSIAFSPDGQTLAAGTAGVNRNLAIFRVADGTQIRITEAHYNGTTGVAFTRDGGLLVTGGRDRTVKLWRAADGALLNTLDQGARVNSVAVSPDGQTVAAGVSNGQIKLWRATDGAPLGSLTGHSEYVFALAFSANGTLLASGAADESVRLWSLPALPGGSSIRTMPLPNAGAATSVVITPNGQTVIAGTAEQITTPNDTIQPVGALRFWRVADGASILADNQQGGITVEAVALSPDGSLLGYGRRDGSVLLAPNPF